MLIVSLSDKNNLNSLKNLVDGVVVYLNDFSSFYNKSFTVDEILEIYEIRDNLKIFLDLTIMMENKDIERLNLLLDKLANKDFYFIYSDLGVYEALRERGLENKGIYNSQTLCTNQYDQEFYLKQNMLSSAISLEIPVSDQIKISEYNNYNVFLKAFGYHQMFYSKRNLISLYKEYKNLDFKIDKYNSYLREIKRENDFFHIYEFEKGTIIFRDYILSYLNELDLIKPNFIYLDNIFIADDIFKEVVNIYSSYLNNKILKDIAIENLNKLNLYVKDGFKFRDSVYQKEEF